MFSTAKEILNIISQHGGEARFVGGCVRDYIHKLPVTDIDIACDLTPDETTKIFDNLGIKTIPTGINFGTITILYKNKPYEITTLRADLNCDGRHAEVKFSNSFEEDSNRRDFTFNALYMDAIDKIYDFHNGITDLKKGVVKFIGNADERIREDYLRILRYFRFHTKYSKGEMLSSELDACIKNIDGLKNISGERIRVEFLKLIMIERPAKVTAVLKIMEEEGFLKILSDIKKFGIENILVNSNPILVLASVLPLENFKEAVTKIASKWHLSKKDKNYLLRLNTSLEIDYENEDKYQINNSARINGKEEFLDYLILNYFKKRINSSVFASLTNDIQHFYCPPFPIASEDFISQGYSGKQLGELLKKAEEIWEKSEYVLSKNDILKKVLGR